MLDAFLDWIGPYTPVYTDVYAADGTYLGNVVASGFAGVDWSWVMTALLGIVVIYCLLRMIGGWLSK